MVGYTRDRPRQFPRRPSFFSRPQFPEKQSGRPVPVRCRIVQKYVGSRPKGSKDCRHRRGMRLASLVLCLSFALRGSDASLSKRETSSLEQLVQRFNRALMRHSEAELRLLLSSEAAHGEIGCGNPILDAGLTAGQPVMTEESPSTARIVCIRPVRSDVAVLDVHRTSFTSGGGRVTRTYTLVAAKEDGAWRIFVVKLLAIAYG